MNTSRFSELSRRHFLAGMSLAAVTGLAACATNDKGSTAAAPVESQTTSGTQATPETQTSAASEGSSAAAESSSSAPAAASGAELAASAQGAVTFTFAGNSFKNPYYAVWIEDAQGALVKTLMLCHLAGGQDRWLQELTKWYSASGGSDTTTEGTKPAGTYTAAWDGTDTTGARAKAGSYTVCVESAVEHGNYSFVSKPVTLGSAAVEQDLGSDGDISAAAFKFTV